MVERNPKREKLIKFSKQQADEYGSGKVDNLSTYSELANLFGYHESSISGILRAEGVNKIRRQAEREREPSPITPSKEAAWIIGYLSGQSLQTRKNQIVTAEENTDVRDRLSSYFKKVFGETSITFPNRKLKKSILTMVSINSKEAVAKIGNLSPTTFRSKVNNEFPWITHDEFNWKFIEGVIEKRGSFSEKGLYISSKHEEYVEFLSEFFSNSGISQTTIKRSQDNSVLYGINIPLIKDLQLIADHIELTNKEKRFRMMKYGKVENHPHHWIVESPNGEKSVGTCKVCGTTKEFWNTTERQRNPKRYINSPRY